MKSFLLKRLPQISLSALIVLLLLFLASKDRNNLFFQSATAAQIFKYYSPMAMLALGMTFIILTGGIDLSVGFVMMLLMFVMARLMRDYPQMAPAMALGAGFLTALLVGVINGVSVAYVRIPAFIVTLAVMVASYGVTLILNENQAISDLSPLLLWLGNTNFRFLGADFPIMTLVVVVAFAGAAVLLNKTSWGRHLYAVGSNREAARLSGVNVPRIELSAYLLSTLCVWIAAWMQMGINRSADPKVALSDNLELNAIAIVVIGGTSLMGGRGGVSGTALGSILLSLIFYGLQFVEIREPSYKKIIQGGIIFLGAIFDTVQRRFNKSG
jgi:fructose transport system permease protein